MWDGMDDFEDFLDHFIKDTPIFLIFEYCCAKTHGDKTTALNDSWQF